MEKRELTKAAIGVSSAVFLACILEFITSIILAKYFGTTIHMDAYLFAISFPNLVFSFLSVSLGMVLIPIFIEYRDKNGDDKTDRFISVMINIIAAALITLALFGSIMATHICSLAGFKGEGLRIASNLFAMLSFLTPIFGLISIEKNILNAYKRFSLPAFSSIISPILVIGAVVILTERLGIYSLTSGIIIGSFLQMFFLGWLVLRIINYTPAINVFMPEIKKVWLMTLPLMFSAAASQINLFVDRLIAIKFLAAGDVSALNYGSIVRETPIIIFTFSIATVMYPTMSRLAISDGLIQLNNMIISVLRLTVFLLLPITVLLLLLGKPLVALLFERGAFSPASTQKTVSALQFYMVGVLPVAMCIIFSRYFYAIQDIATPVKLGLMAVLLNIILDIFLTKLLGIGGIALATSLVEIAFLIVFCFLWIKRNRENAKIQFFLNSMGAAFLKITFATLIMGIICYLTLDGTGLLTGYYGDTAFKILRVMIPLTVASISYLVICYFLKVEEFRILREGVVSALSGKGR